MTSLSLHAKSPRPFIRPAAVDSGFVKFVVIVNGIVPAALLMWDAAHGRLGANPVNFAIRTTGMLTLVFLCLSLTVTPLRKITRLQWLFYARRNLGLYAFFYGMSHFLLFFVLDRGLNVSSTFSEMLKRKYLLVGSAGVLFMIPLAATSFNFMIKRMGAKRWQALHRLAYLAALCAVLHYYMLVKADVRLPIAFAVVLTLLLGFRLVAWLVNRSEKSTAVATSTGSANTWTGQLRVAKIIQQTPNVRTFQLELPNTAALPFDYLPGQHLSLTLTIDGKKVYRSYTIASSPSRPGTCELTIKREDRGVSSRHLHDNIHEGDLLDISAASGDFTFNGTGDATAIALLAGGVGITPLMSILRYLTDKNWPGRIYLLYSNKTEDEIIFKDELDDLAAKHGNLHVVYTLTRPSGAEWTGRVGRIDAALLGSTIPDLTHTPAYICGPSEMIEAMKLLLRSLHVPLILIHSESFGSARTADDPLAATFTVTFAKSRKQRSAPSNKPLLEIAEDANVPADFECRSGICGRCKCPLLSGSVEMATQDALTAADRHANIILLCQAKAREDVTIQL